jgi:hypothetical protein
MTKGAGDPCLADAGGAGDQQVLLALDPFSLCQPLEQGSIEPAMCAVVDILGGWPSGADRRSAAVSSGACCRVPEPRDRPASPDDLELRAIVLSLLFFQCIEGQKAKYDEEL